MVSQADTVGFDEEEEILGVAGRCNSMLVEDLDLGQLAVGDAQRLVGMVAVLKDDFEQVIAGARLKLFDLG